jgi:hypothetical protein
MRVKVLLAFVAVVLFATSLGQSQTMARESFSYPQTTLIGLGTASHGFGGPWEASANGTEGLISLSGTRFAYNDLNWALPHDTTHLQWVKSNAWSDANRYTRPLAAALPNTLGKSYFLSYMIDVKDSLPVANTYFMVKLYGGSSEIVALGKGGGQTSPVWSCGSGWPGSSSPDNSSKAIVRGPIWLVMRMDMSGNGTDPCKTFMWVDPDPTVDPDTATADVKRNSTVPVGGITNIAIEFGGDGVNTRLIFDEITLAPSFSALTVTGVAAPGKNVPSSFELSQNYPNPFNPSTMVSYSVPKSGFVTLKVYNMIGQEVATLFSGVRNAGTFQARFDASSLSSGVYFCRLISEGIALTTKMALVK